MAVLRRSYADAIEGATGRLSVARRPEVLEQLVNDLLVIAGQVRDDEAEVEQLREVQRTAEDFIAAVQALGGTPDEGKIPYREGRAFHSAVLAARGEALDG